MNMEEFDDVFMEIDEILEEVANNEDEEQEDSGYASDPAIITKSKDVTVVERYNTPEVCISHNFYLETTPRGYSRNYCLDCFIINRLVLSPTVRKEYKHKTISYYEEDFNERCDKCHEALFTKVTRDMCRECRK